MINNTNSRKSTCFTGTRQNSVSNKKDFAALKEAAIKYDLPDFFIGLPFNRKNKPSIEHVIPYCIFPESEKSEANKLQNLVVTLPEINEIRRDKTIAEFIKDGIRHKGQYYTLDQIIDNMVNLIQKYRKVVYLRVNGSMWVDGLKPNLIRQMRGLSERHIDKIRFASNSHFTP